MYEVLEKLLKERGETFADLSRATGIGQTTLSNLKARGGCLSFENAQKAAEYLGVPLESLAAD